MSSGGAPVRSFRDLVVWQKAMRLVELVYALAAQLPSDERYGLSLQLRRSAVSVPSNIAEGHAREATRDFTRYIAIARGSLAELETQLELLERLNIVPASQAVAEALAHCDELGRILRGLRKSLDAKLASAHR